MNAVLATAEMAIQLCGLIDLRDDGDLTARCVRIMEGLEHFGSRYRQNLLQLEQMRQQLTELQGVERLLRQRDEEVFQLRDDLAEARQKLADTAAPVVLSDPTRTLEQRLTALADQLDHEKRLHRNCRRSLRTVTEHFVQPIVRAWRRDQAGTKELTQQLGIKPEWIQTAASS